MSIKTTIITIVSTLLTVYFELCMHCMCISFQLIPQSYETGTFIIPFMNVTKVKKWNDIIQSHIASM